VVTALAFLEPGQALRALSHVRPVHNLSVYRHSLYHLLPLLRLHSAVVKVAVHRAPVCEEVLDFLCGVHPPFSPFGTSFVSVKVVQEHNLVHSVLDMA
jgi:hypothetical protein